ncbi:hypothetical protein CspHIS471_0609540 [Cutaneotrichosporon sp. HIS471]|nr:hypothetical protein CspHIS471_0609540 [Cutaneotrichosporon sp. HIS471]
MGNTKKGTKPKPKPKVQVLDPPPAAVTTGDGFYRWADITFEWVKALDNEYERRAITSLVHKTVITKPNHPLAGKDASGKAQPVKLYECLYADGKRQLCYSLGQIQYLQYYMFECRLTDPNHANNLKEPATDPDDDEKPIRYIPLPAGLIPAESFKSVKLLVVDQDPSKYDKMLRQENKRHIKQMEIASMMSPALPSPTDSPSSPSCTAGDLEPTGEPEPTAPLGYFEQVQQAVILAHAGGLKAVQQEIGENCAEQFESDAATGRGLFIAIYARELPDFDGSPVLKDVGFDAVYFATNPDDTDGDRTEGPQDRDVCTEMHDREHWLVEEEIGFKGAPAPYLFKKDLSLSGGSLSKPLARIAIDFKKKLVDLWRRAGKGPVYILNHSVDWDLSGFDALGIDVDEIDTRLHNFANSSSNGNKFLIDTSRLFGDIENGLPGTTPLASTPRTLEDIMTLIYGPNPNPANGVFDNAGNRATFNMKIFMKLVHNWDHETLQDVRAWLDSRIANASIAAEPQPPPPGVSSRIVSPPPATATSTNSTSVGNTPTTHDILLNGIVNALSHAKIEGHHSDPQDSMVERPIDDDDSDWEGGGQFMVMNSVGELVTAFDDGDE